MGPEEVIEVTGCLPGAVPPIAAFPKEARHGASNGVEGGGVCGR